MMKKHYLTSILTMALLVAMAFVLPKETGIFAQDCNTVTITGATNTIYVNGLIAPVNEVQVIKGDWSAKVFSCLGDCDEPNQTITGLPAGLYYVLIKFYAANYSLICERYEDVMVTDLQCVVTITGGTGKITVGGLTGPNNQVQVFNSSWASVFSCFNNCDTPVHEITGLSAGTYYVMVKIYSSSWLLICEETEYVTVSAGPPTPCDNVVVTDGGGTITVSGLTGPAAQVQVQVYKGDWSATVFNCLGTCNTPVQVIPNLPNGLYHVSVKFYNSSYALICEKILDVTVSGDLCSNVMVSVNDDSIIVSGLIAPVSEVQVIKSDWSSKVFLCLGDCDTPEQVISMLDPGLYHLIVKFYTANYHLICETRPDAVIPPDATHLIIDLNTVLTKDAAVDLFWINNTRNASDYFVVEKSTDGIDFQPLLERATEGMAGDVKLYRELDRNPAEGNNFYRVKIVHADGTFTFSPISVVSFLPDADFTVFPNPAHGSIMVYMDRFIGKEVELMVINAQGQVLLTRQFAEVQDAIFPLELSSDRFQDGIYNIAVNYKGKVHSRRLVLSRY